MTRAAATSQPGRARSAEYHPNLVDFFAGDFQRVQERCSGNDGRPVLIVMKHRNLRGLAKRLLDIEAFRRFDVFQIDAATCGLEHPAELDDLIRHFGIDFEIKDINIRKAFEQHSFAFHHGLAGCGADVAEPQDRRPIRNHGHQIAPRRVLKAEVR